MKELEDLRDKARQYAKLLMEHQILKEYIDKKDDIKEEAIYWKNKYRRLVDLLKKESKKKDSPVKALLDKHTKSEVKHDSQ